MLVGTPIAPGDRKVIEIDEATGARIVGDLLPSGYAAYIDFMHKGDSLKTVINAYLDRLPHAALPAMDLNADRRLLALAALAQEAEANGIVYYSLRYCDPFSFKMLSTKECMKGLRIPLLEVHTDYSEMDIETLRTRVEAFVEMLDV